MQKQEPMANSIPLNLQNYFNIAVWISSRYHMLRIMQQRQLAFLEHPPCFWWPSQQRANNGHETPVFAEIKDNTRVTHPRQFCTRSAIIVLQCLLYFLGKIGQFIFHLQCWPETTSSTCTCLHLNSVSMKALLIPRQFGYQIHPALDTATFDMTKQYLFKQ